MTLVAELQMLAVAGITVGVFVAFLREWAKPDVIAMTAMVAVLAIGALKPSDVAALFSNSAPITIAAMFVISAALERTGVMDWLAQQFARLAGRSTLRALAILGGMVIPLSAFANNTPIVVVFLPVLMAFSRQSDLPASKLLIPLSYFAILGGTCTLLGTSTNILASGIAEKMGQPHFGLFEITPLGFLYALMGFIYLLLAAPRLLPERHTLSSLLSSDDTRSFCSQAIILPNSKFLGKTFPETPLGQSRSAILFEVIRNGHRVTDTPLDQLPLKPNDILILKCSAKDVAAISESGDLSFDDSPSAPHAEVRLVEAIIGPHSPMLGKTIRQLGLRRRFGVVAVALHRRGQNLTDQFQDIPLQFGDTLLFEGPEQNLARLREEDDFLSLNESPHRPHRAHKAPLALLAFGAVILLSAFDVIPILVAALVAAVLVVLLGCLDPEEAYASIDWQILFLIVGMLALGKAIENTGIAALIAQHWAALFHNAPPQLLIASIYLLATILTELVTNNAVAIILTPIAINIAESLALSPRPFIVTVMFAASASFCTPIGYQTNTYVFGAGGYKFSDFFRIGIPLNLLLLLLASLLIPIFWPLR